MKHKRHVYLISDATGETVRSIARACAVQFENIEVVEHLWPMVRSRRALDIVLEDLGGRPGLVFYTMLSPDLLERLEAFCRERRIPHISVLQPFISLMAQHFGQPAKALPGRQHALDAEYFQRIDAINFVLAHDDGQQPGSLDQAEVILVGVSRTSKTPTCIYLANRGIKAANVPVVPGLPLPEALFSRNNGLVVGLTEDPARLVEIRKNRLRLQEGISGETDYTNFEKVREEVAEARKLFLRQGWPVIDVTRRSIEETAAAVLQLLGQRQRLHVEGSQPA
jgi:regulator of PEP synthase PpsR (kinase-PPPase family)